MLCDDCGNQLACGVTDQNGEVVFDCLPFGKYVVKEIEAPCGFEKSDKCAAICIDSKTSNPTVEFVNRRMTGSIKVISSGVDCCGDCRKRETIGRGDRDRDDSNRSQNSKNDKDRDSRSNRNQNPCSCPSCQGGDPGW